MANNVALAGEQAKFGESVIGVDTTDDIESEVELNGEGNSTEGGMQARVTFQQTGRNSAESAKNRRPRSKKKVESPVVQLSASEPNADEDVAVTGESLDLESDGYDEEIDDMSTESIEDIPQSGILKNCLDILNEMQRMLEMREELLARLRDYDKLRNDLLHEIEFESYYTDDKKIELYAKLQKASVFRREIKDAVSAITQMSECLGLSPKSIRKARERVDALKYRTYSPRISHTVADELLKME